MTLPLRIELAMTLKADFPSVLAAFRTGQAGFAAIDAVSGRNILILRPNASAADLKSLHCKWRIRPRDFKSKSGTGIKGLRVPIAFRSSRKEDAERLRELRKVGTGILGNLTGFFRMPH